MPVTKSFVEYIKKQPLIFEVFGHYQQQQQLQQQQSVPGGQESTACADGGVAATIVSSTCEQPASLSPSSNWQSVGNLRHPPRKMLPPSLPISQPVRSISSAVDPRAVTPTNEAPASSIGAASAAAGGGATQEVHSKHDLLVWFEVLELGRTDIIHILI